jgi:hypothetical protein
MTRPFEARRRLNPTPPFLTRQRLRYRGQRRRLRYAAGRALRVLADLLDPPPTRAAVTAGHPSTALRLVPDNGRKAEAEEFWRRVDAGLAGPRGGIRYPGTEQP